MLHCQQVPDHEQVLGGNFAACAVLLLGLVAKAQLWQCCKLRQMAGGSVVKPIILVEAELVVLIVHGSPPQAS